MTVVRDAQLADARALGALHARTWREAYWGVLPEPAIDRETAERRTRFWRSHLSRMRHGGWPLDENASLAWTDADAPVGYVWTGPPRAEEAEWEGEIYMLYVLQSAQRGGVGRALMAEAARSLVRRGFFRIGLWVLEDNGPAHAFYEALGGRPAGARREALFGGSLPVQGYVWEDAGVLLGGSMALG